MAYKVAVLPGDGIGPEIVAETVKVLDVLRQDGLSIELEFAAVGGAAFAESGDPLPESTLSIAQAADAILFGAVGDFKYDTLPRDKRPEQAILKLRQCFGLFANLRPILVYPELAQASSLKPELVEGLDILILRELNGDIYFGEPRGIRTLANGERQGFNTMTYTETQIRNVARSGFEAARMRSKKLCSVDKMNVLETMELWREIVIEVGADYPDVELSHMYVDNAAMQLVYRPKQFDVILTGNMFGDILSDLASTLTGSIGMLPSAALNIDRFGLFEPIHGSAPDIAGKDIANPIATILSAAMLLRYSLLEPVYADRIENAVRCVLAQGLRTADINQQGARLVGTKAMGDAIAAAVASQSCE